MDNLKAENAWLNLAGLFWLDDGKNGFGSDKQKKLVSPDGGIKAQAVYTERTETTVKLV